MIGAVPVIAGRWAGFVAAVRLCGFLAAVRLGGFVTAARLGGFVAAARPGGFATAARPRRVRGRCPAEPVPNRSRTDSDAVAARPATQ